MVSDASARIQELETALRETLEQQAATSSLLNLVNSSALDMKPVLQTVVETAARLCGADMCSIMRSDGGTFRAAVEVGYAPDFWHALQRSPIVAGMGSTTGRVVLTRTMVHIDDVAADPDYTLREAAKLSGHRTALGVPLLQGGDLLGVLMLARKRVLPFTERQIAVLRIVAAAAVIAIRNARLLE